MPSVNFNNCSIIKSNMNSQTQSMVFGTRKTAAFNFVNGQEYTFTYNNKDRVVKVNRVDEKSELLYTNEVSTGDYKTFSMRKIQNPKCVSSDETKKPFNFLVGEKYSFIYNNQDRLVNVLSVGVDKIKTKDDEGNYRTFFKNFVVDPIHISTLCEDEDEEEKENEYKTNSIYEIEYDNKVRRVTVLGEDDRIVYVNENGQKKKFTRSKIQDSIFVKSLNEYYVDNDYEIVYGTKKRKIVVKGEDAERVYALEDGNHKIFKKESIKEPVLLIEMEKKEKEEKSEIKEEIKNFRFEIGKVYDIVYKFENKPTPTNIVVKVIGFSTGSGCYDYILGHEIHKILCLRPGHPQPNPQMYYRKYMISAKERVEPKEEKKEEKSQIEIFAEAGILKDGYKMPKNVELVQGKCYTMKYKDTDRLVKIGNISDTHIGVLEGETFNIYKTFKRSECTDIREVVDKTIKFIVDKEYTMKYKGKERKVIVKSVNETHIQVLENGKTKTYVISKCVEPKMVEKEDPKELLEKIKEFVNKYDIIREEEYADIPKNLDDRELAGVYHNIAKYYCVGQLRLIGAVSITKRLKVINTAQEYSTIISKYGTTEETRNSSKELCVRFEKAKNNGTLINMYNM